MADLDDQGFTILKNAVSPTELITLKNTLSSLETSSRHLLSTKSIGDLADSIRRSTPWLKENAPIQATYFIKSQTANWFVAPHRDLVVPLSHHHIANGWAHPTTKEGIPFMQAPDHILDQCVSVRIQVDSPQHGDLVVFPKSHTENGEDALTPHVCQGDALLMKPRLMHSSPKLRPTQEQRRVVHILYGPKSLPAPFEWFRFSVQPVAESE